MSAGNLGYVTSEAGTSQSLTVIMVMAVIKSNSAILMITHMISNVFSRIYYVKNSREKFDRGSCRCTLMV
jgi:hypothetical protein